MNMVLFSIVILPALHFFSSKLSVLNDKLLYGMQIFKLIVN